MNYKELCKKLQYDPSTRVETKFLPGSLSASCSILLDRVWIQQRFSPANNPDYNFIGQDTDVLFLCMSCNGSYSVKTSVQKWVYQCGLQHVPFIQWNGTTLRIIESCAIIQSTNGYIDEPIDELFDWLTNNNLVNVDFDKWSNPLALEFKMRWG